MERELMGSPSSQALNPASPEDTEKDVRADKGALTDIASPASPRDQSPLAKRKLTPAEAVLAGEILFPDQEEPWYERSISLPRHFEGPSAPPTYVEVDDLSVPVFTYMVYGLFSGFLIVLILIAIVAYIISFTSRDHVPPKSPVFQPLVLCYYDPTMSTTISPPFTRSNLCMECCSYLIYNAFTVDPKGIVKERTPTGPAPAENVNDWLALKQMKMKVLCGLHFMPAPAFADLSDPRLKQIVESLSSTYAAFEGAAFMWNSPETKQEIIFYEKLPGKVLDIARKKLRNQVAGSNYTIIAHLEPVFIDTYDFANMNKYVDIFVVNTHNFAVAGRAFPPCMYEQGGIMDVVDKNLVDVLNRILTPAPYLNSRLAPTVSTVGKKYVFEDATNTKVGDRVDLTKPAEDFPLFKLCQERSSWTTQMDNKTKCDTAFNSKMEWIGFESPTSVFLKTELVKKKRLLGIAVLDIEQDDREACSIDKKPYLLGAVNRGLRSR